MNSHVEEEIKEIYALFGSAIYFNQCIERQLGILLIILDFQERDKEIHLSYDILLNSYFHKTLGHLIKHLTQKIEISDKFEVTIREALDKRNWLTHHYFWDRAIQMNTEDGREFMVEELEEINLSLESVDTQLTEICRNLERQYGVTDEIIEKELNNLLKSTNGKSK